MNKRGDVSILYWILAIIISIVLILTLPKIALRAAKGDLSNEEIIAKDIALQINALQSVKGDAYIKNTGLEEYTIKFEDGKISVYKEKKDMIKPAYLYSGSRSFELDQTIINKNVLFVIKEGGKIKLSETEPITQLSCPDIKIEKTENIGLDPLNPEVAEDMSLKIAEELKPVYRNTIKFSRMSKDIERNLNDLKESDIIITLKFGDYGSGENYLKAYYIQNSNKELESKKVACNILKKLSDGINEKNIFLIPIDSEEYDKEKIVVIIEIANKNNQKIMEELQHNPAKIARLIRDGLNEAFK